MSAKYIHPTKKMKAPPVVKLKDVGGTSPKSARILCACSGTKDARSGRPGVTKKF